MNIKFSNCQLLISSKSLIFFILFYNIVFTTKIYADNDTAIKLQISPEVIDFKEFREGQLRKRQITITNNSANDIIIEQAGSGCPCLTVKMGQRTISPKNKIQITIELHTLGLTDKQDRKVTLVYRDKVTNEVYNHEIPVKGYVKRAPAQLAIYPESALFGNIAVGDTREADIVIFNLTEKPLKLEQAVAETPGVTVELPENTIVPAGLYKKIKIIVEGEKLDIGPLESAVIVTTDFSLHNTIKIPIKATIRNEAGSTLSKREIDTESIDTF